ncbi:MAG: hypothetical protein GF317_07080 [Candidatus Lokiarchaeota archaeon]|nr:hypothetical protein [Candidatus Lokiarchaeota archaeon]MBD3199471.1 hypothetical protein [Candidatus Lokiarchaeota archaeon]
MREIPPPFCFICKNDFEDKVDRMFYCICDTAVCDECVNSVKNSESTWICPKCNTENNLEKSKLFRENP